MLKRFFKKEKSRVFLGTVAVAPRSDMKRYLDELGVFGEEDLDSSIRSSLEKIFDLPDVRDVENPKANDLGLDIIVPKFQSGDAWSLSLGDIGVPLVWRPKIEIGSRLFNIKTGKTVHTESLVVKMHWREYIARLFTWRAFLRFKPMFDSKDMDRLLHVGCLELLSKLRKFA